jgi:2-polyprenyl-3-methyl-5-hydroxy-6-metoxy-1,4-benzoquinol methylase
MNADSSRPTVLTYAGENASPYLKHTRYGASPMHRNRLAWVIDAISAQAPPNPKTSILDIGCGLGNIAIPLASLGYRVTGIDLHAPTIDTARQRNPFPNLALAVTPLEALDISSFDVLVLSEVLEHVSEWQGMLQYLARGMRSDATLILTVPNGWGPMEMVCRPSYRMKTTAIGARVVRTIKRLLNTADLTTGDAHTPHVNFFRLSVLHRAFDAAQLRVQSCGGMFFLWPLWEIFFSNRCSEKWAARDFRFGQRIPLPLRAVWVFSLERAHPM